VILHSSSAEYRQHAGIPYAMFAAENGWAVIAPQFRGVNDDPESMGSDLAVQDVVDAIDHAVSQDGVDPERVYAVGYSGGGTMALLLAGRHPDKVTAVAAWGPPYDLISFYRESARSGTHYAGDIINACGGDPTDSEEARQDCLHRSPITHLDTAREEAVPVFIAQGIHDSILAPSHGAAAFNQLADPDDRFTEEQLESLARGGVPDDISEPVSAETHFGDGDPAPVLTRQSASAWLTLFDADHEMAYQPTLRWFADDPR
jgi:dipeptidyl aminopeptidase/acylaminoacyl peptidase